MRTVLGGNLCFSGVQSEKLSVEFHGLSFVMGYAPNSGIVRWVVEDSHREFHHTLEAFLEK